MPSEHDSLIRVRGALQNNLKGVDCDIPRNAFVVFTGVSGSGKSSLAFGTLYAEAQRRYFESIAPYARRLLDQLPAPRVREITGLPPAVAIQQRRAEPTSRSSVGTITKLSNTLRMLFSRAGTYPAYIKDRLDSEAFSPNTLAGACETCHGVGLLYTVTEQSLVPDASLTIREKAIAAWPGAWQGKNYRDILAVLGYNVDIPWKDLPQKDRNWILFTDEKPVVTVHAEREAHRIQRPYQGTYMSAAAYVRHTFSTTNSATLRKRVSKFMEASRCPECNGKRLKKESLAVHFAGHDIAELMRMPMRDLSTLLASASAPAAKSGAGSKASAGSKTSAAASSASTETASMLSADLIERIALISELGLDYLSLDRTAPTLSAGELQRLRLVSQLKSGLFGVVYVLDEPSAGLHPRDTDALFAMLRRLQSIGNSLLVVEHDMHIVKTADWIVDLGPGAGDGGGHLLHSGTVDGLKSCKDSETRRFLFDSGKKLSHSRRKAKEWLTLSGITMHNLDNLEVRFPLGVLTVVTGVSGSGKSTLVSQVLSNTVRDHLGSRSSNNKSGAREADDDDNDNGDDSDEDELALYEERINSMVASVDGVEALNRLVSVDQKPIGRTPRSNVATYTGLFDHIRKLFAATAEAKRRKYTASRFSFNVDGGRCKTCEGEGFLSVELLFLPSVYSPCTDCHGTRYNPETLQVQYQGKNIAEVLDLTVDGAAEFFKETAVLSKGFKTLIDVGLGYLHLGQPATEVSGGEAQRIKLATELQRARGSGSLYILDEPTTGLHPADVEKLVSLLHALADGGSSVIVVEHDVNVISAADWVIDLGPGAGDDGGRVVAAGTPEEVSSNRQSHTAAYIKSSLAGRH